MISSQGSLSLVPNLTFLSLFPFSSSSIEFRQTYQQTDEQFHFSKLWRTFLGNSIFFSLHIDAPWGRFCELKWSWDGQKWTLRSSHYRSWLSLWIKFNPKDLINSSHAQMWNTHNFLVHADSCSARNHVPEIVAYLPNISRAIFPSKVEELSRDKRALKRFESFTVEFRFFFSERKVVVELENSFSVWRQKIDMTRREKSVQTFTHTN